MRHNLCQATNGAVTGWREAFGPKAAAVLESSVHSLAACKGQTATKVDKHIEARKPQISCYDTIKLATQLSSNFKHLQKCLEYKGLLNTVVKFLERALD